MFIFIVVEQLKIKRIIASAVCFLVSPSSLTTVKFVGDISMLSDVKIFVWRAVDIKTWDSFI